MTVDTELVAQIWAGDEDGTLERCIIHVDRSDLDEVNVMVVEGNETTHLYLAPDRAVRLAQALIYEASKEWRLP